MAGKKGRSGRPRKPAAQHILDGTYEPSRHRNRADNAPAEGWPDKPGGLTPAQDQLWETVVTYLPPECVGAVDTAALRDLVRWYGIYCDLIAVVEQDPLDAKTLNSALKAWDRVWKMMQDYGLTPVARSRLQIPKKPGNEGSGMAALTKLLESRN